MSALIESYSSNNRVIESDLVISYSKQRIFGTWQYALPGGITTYTSAWQYTRTATKTYKYVGMTQDAANTCKDDMLDIYLRDTQVSTWDPVVSISEFTDVDGGQITMAEISVRHVAGEMYETIINVRETDSRLRFTPAPSVETLFSTENNREYDD